MADATIRGTLPFSNNGVPAIVATLPTDDTKPVAGDWLIAGIVDTGANGSGYTVPAPSGWTVLLARQAMGTRNVTWWGKRYVAGETSYTWTASGNSLQNGALLWGPGGVLDPAKWQVGSYLKGANSTVSTAPSITTSVKSLVLALFGVASSATGQTDAQNTIASPFTKARWFNSAPTSLINSLFAGSLAQTTAGATGDAVYTHAGAATGNLGSVQIAIPTLVDAVAHLAGRMFDGTDIVDGSYQLWDGTDLVELAGVQLVRMGRKVSELHANGHVPVIAHRGGSRDYAEHSLRGYTQCAIAGVDALEFSVAVTKDKKWIGLHDSTINRTSPDAPADWNPQDHTWAEVQAFQVQVGDLAGFGPQPYMLLDDLVAAYGSSHTLVLDPKVIGAGNMDAFFAYIQTIPDFRERVVLKYFHTGTSTADRARAIGCKSWGYSYSDDVNAVNSPSTAATAAKWDFLGLEYSANKATWDAILAIAGDKPVWGHICPTAATAATAVSLGARGLMVSGVESVMAERYYLDANAAR